MSMRVLRLIAALLVFVPLILIMIYAFGHWSNLSACEKDRYFYNHYTLLITSLTVLVITVGGFVALVQLQETGESRKLQAVQGLFKMMDDPELLKTTQAMIPAYLDSHNLQLTPGPELKDGVDQLIKRYSMVGILLHLRLIEWKVVRHWSDAYIRTWFILSHYIDLQRQGRSHPTLHRGFQYVAIKSLTEMLYTEKREKLGIYQARSSQPKDILRPQLVSECKKRNKELKDWGMEVRELEFLSKVRDTILKVNDFEARLEALELKVD